jgi:DNA-binding response OmpR family regulator
METTENPCRILIVDDQESMRLLLAHYVTQELHAQVELAGTCEAALHLAEHKTYDVILLDLLMPGIGGFEVLKSIRAGSANKTTPVIVISILVTSLMGEGAMAYDHAIELGADAFVSKPVAYNALIAAVKAAVAKAQQRETVVVRK